MELHVAKIDGCAVVLALQTDMALRGHLGQRRLAKKRRDVAAIGIFPGRIAFLHVELRAIDHDAAIGALAVFELDIDDEVLVLFLGPCRKGSEVATLIARANCSGAVPYWRA